jgi:hypothetical protein
MNKTLQEILKNDTVQQTLKISEKYCDFMEYVRLNEISQEDFINKLHLLLSDLYQQSIRLPKIELIIEKEPKEIDLKKQEPILGNRLTEILGKFANYSEAFDPMIIEDKENYLHGWLVDDLTDIYNDLYRIIEKIKINTDEYIQDGLWDLKFGLGTHWGHHLIDALRFIHYLQYSNFARHLD